MSYTYVIYSWNAAAFGDSDDEDINDAAEHGENMEGGGGEIPNEAGVLRIAVFSRRNWKYGGEETPSSAKYTSTTSNRTWWAIVSSICEIRNI